LISTVKFLAGVCTVSLACGATTGWAQDSAPAQFDWLESHRSYERNSYALEIPLTDDNFSQLQSHLRQYQFLLLYFPQESPDAATANIRIGFFASEKQAQDFQRATAFLIQQQKVVKVSALEHNQVITELSRDLASPAGDDALVVIPIDGKPDNKISNSQEALLERAKNFYIAKQYSQAAQLYQVLAAFADAKTAAWAKELTALCYEKMGEREKAIAQYRAILAEQPDDSGNTRVAQRLRGLETATMDDPSALKAAGKEKDRDWYTRGIFGQYYRTVDRSVNGGDKDEVLGLLSTDLDVRSSLRVGDHTLNARINGYRLDDQLDSTESETVIKRLMVDYKHAATGFGAVLGRQKDSDSGVYTSFDGLTLRWDKDDWGVAVSAGEPVFTSDFYDPLDYSFYSVNSYWNLSEAYSVGAYWVNQKVNGVTDREAIGAHGRYFSEKFTAWFNIDYDTAFAELNNLLLNFTYRFTENAYVSGVYGSQRSPFLTATNIFIGQADLDLETYLQVKENKDNLLDDAFARTSMNDYYTLTFVTQAAEKVRWQIDFYDSVLSDVPSAEFLLGLPETGQSADTFSYQSIGSQLIFDNFFFSNDSATLGVRHANGDTSDSTQLFIYERMRLGRKLTVMPKLSYAEIGFLNNDDTQKQIRYSISLTYRPWRNAEFNLEAGNESITTTQSNLEFDSQYLFIGYRVFL